MADYDDIPGIMRHMVRVMELSPNAFQNMGEEDLRTCYERRSTQFISSRPLALIISQPNFHQTTISAHADYFAVLNVPQHLTKDSG
jgi:hypothetical protein